MKNKFFSLFTGIILPAFGSQLKGLKLKVHPQLSMSLFWRNIEPAKHLLYRLVVKENDVIFDIGANTGLHSIFLAKLYSSVKIFAFEPLPANVKYIKDIKIINKLVNIEVIESAIGAHVGDVFFNTSTNNSMGHISEQKTGLKVKINTLDEFISFRKLNPNFIKIDVEGSEIDVLQGFSNLIETVFPIIVIESHNPENDLAISAFFKNYKYTIYRLADLKDCENGIYFKTIKNLNSSWPDLDGVWGNIVAIPKYRVGELMKYID